MILDTPTLHNPRPTFLALSAICSLALAVSPANAHHQTQSEKDSLKSWMDKSLLAPAGLQASSVQAATKKVRNSINVEHAVHRVIKNRTVWDTPLVIGDKTFSRGIYMDAPAALRVRLAKPAKEFSATVGIDNNSNTKNNPDVGSVRFHVSVDGRRVFSSAVRKLADGFLPIKVPLGGATEFTIEVDDGDNGRSHDQADWANAAVTFEDGETRLLDSLPIDKLHTKGHGNPFFFVYGDKPSTALIANWKRTEESKTTDNKTVKTIRYQCPETGLLVETQITTYKDSAAVDWLCFFENRGKVDTPIIKDIVPVDLSILETPADTPVVLRWSNGDAYHCPKNHYASFLPHDDLLQCGKSRQFAPPGGRSSNGVKGGVFPFFNVLGQNDGWIVAIGWSGQWEAGFTRQKNGNVLLDAGMKNTHFRLKPGERIRTPRIVMLRYHSDKMIDGHNRFRRFMCKHYYQKKNGRPIIPPICHNTAATVYRSKQPATEANQLDIIRKMRDLGCEAYWMDAYWYQQHWSTNVGNWVPSAKEFPRGMKPLADAAHGLGMQFVLWFEPERIYKGTPWDKEHSNFLLRLPNSKNSLFNLGDPKALSFLTDFLDSRIKLWDVDVFRNDFNINPLPYWQHNDAPDRRGITQAHYITGLYSMWSELIRRNPGLTIDNCASGGRRIDVEISRYSWPLWRSDLNDIREGLKGEKYWPRMARSDQVHMGGLSLYLPLHAGPVWSMSPYSIRSTWSGALVLYERILHEGFPSELAKQAIAEAKSIREFILGDYYPLMKLTINQDDWWAYQLHGKGEEDDAKDGIAMVFRRPDSKQTSTTLELRKIEPDATYDVSITGETYSTAPFKTMSGRELQKLKIDISEQPGSCLIQYRRQ